MGDSQAADKCKRKSGEKKDAETEVGTEVQMQKEIWKSFKDETKCLVFSSSTNVKKFGDG